MVVGKMIFDAPEGDNGGANQYGASAFQKSKSKKAAYTDLNITRTQADNYQLMARHPEAVEKADCGEFGCCTYQCNADTR